MATFYVRSYPAYKEDRIHILLNKTKQSAGKQLIIEWDQEGEMRALLDEILRIAPRRIGDAPLFVTTSIQSGKSINISL
jgi:hypothetical protein